MFILSLILLIGGITAGSILAFKAITNITKIGFDEAFGNHMKIMKLMIPAALSTLIGTILLVIHLFG